MSCTLCLFVLSALVIAADQVTAALRRRQEARRRSGLGRAWEAQKEREASERRRR